VGFEPTISVLERSKTVRIAMMRSIWGNLVLTFCVQSGLSALCGQGIKPATEQWLTIRCIEHTGGELQRLWSTRVLCFVGTGPTASNYGVQPPYPIFKFCNAFSFLTLFYYQLESLRFYKLICWLCIWRWRGLSNDKSSLTFLRSAGTVSPETNSLPFPSPLTTQSELLSFCKLICCNPIYDLKRLIQ
jgi:hypothetical protein